CRVQARGHERTPGLHLAGDAGIVDVALGREGDDRGFGRLAVLLLERRLQGSQRVTVHAQAMTSTRGPAACPFSAAETRSRARIETATWSSVGSRVVRRWSQRPGASTTRTARKRSYLAASRMTS